MIIHAKSVIMGNEKRGEVGDGKVVVWYKFANKLNLNHARRKWEGQTAEEDRQINK